MVDPAILRAAIERRGRDVNDHFARGRDRRVNTMGATHEAAGRLLKPSTNVG